MLREAIAQQQVLADKSGEIQLEQSEALGWRDYEKCAELEKALNDLAVTQTALVLHHRGVRCWLLHSGHQQPHWALPLGEALSGTVWRRHWLLDLF